MIRRGGDASGLVDDCVARIGGDDAICARLLPEIDTWT
jgi:hypothetical protein